MAVKNILVSMFDAVRMTKKQLQTVVGKFARQARKRANRLLQKEKVFTSPALAGARKTKPKDQQALFEIRGKSRQQLLKEYKRIKNFMESETSTVRGTEKFYKKAAEDISAGGYTDVEPQSLDKMFRVFAQLRETDPWVSNAQYKYEVFDAIQKEMQLAESSGRGKSIEDITSRVQGMLDAISAAKAYDAPETFDDFLDQEDEDEDFNLDDYI